MLIILFSAILGVFAQTGKITGSVVEARTGAPLAAVLVKVQSSGQQAFSDGDGKFEIAGVPVGPQTLLVSVVGYGLVRRDVRVDAANAVDVTIPVAEGASTYVEEVAVSGSPFRESEPGVSSQSTLGSRELLALRGLVADDPFRAVQVLPGVATGDDFRAEFAVRGLGPSNIGISIDGVDNPLLFHTVRGVQDTGTLGLINSDILESATLLSGPHPQRMNSHLGSRLDFTTRDGSRDRLTVHGLLSASAASTIWEGPLGAKKKASWLLAVRKSYIDWLLRKIDSTTDTTFGFLDGEAKLTFDLSSRQSLRVSMIAGKSVLREVEEPTPNTLDHAGNTTVIGNVQWRFTPSATFTTSQQVYVLNAEYLNRVVDGRTREEGSDRDLTWRGGASWNPKAGHLVEFGAQAQSLHMRRVDRRFTRTTEQLLIDATGDAWSAAGWAQYRWTPNAHVTITPGIRFEHWKLFDQSRPSPWLLAELEVRSATRLRFGAGIQHQSATLDQAIFVLPNQELVPERATGLEVGIEQRFGAAWRLNLAAYGRRDQDGFRADDAEVRIVNNRVVIPVNPRYVNSLTGNTTGAEIVLERRSVSGLNGWLSYTWNDTQVEDPVRAGHPVAETFPSDYDQRHTVNAYVAYRWGGRTSLSARMRYGSNFPIAGYIAQDSDGYLLSAQRNGIRVPEYSRLDLRADRTFTYRKSRLTLFLEVVNAMNRDNYRASNPGINIQTRRVFGPLDTLFPLLPVAGILIEF